MKSINTITRDKATLSTFVLSLTLFFGLFPFAFSGSSAHADRKSATKTEIVVYNRASTKRTVTYKIYGETVRSHAWDHLDLTEVVFRLKLYKIHIKILLAENSRQALPIKKIVSLPIFSIPFRKIHSDVTLAFRG